LKHTLKDPRPPPPFEGLNAHVPKWGLPSDHSQFVGFFAMYVFLFVRHSREGAVWAGAAWLGCGAVAWSRVYLGYHAPWQVVVGVAVGAASGAAWHALTFRFLQPHYSRICGMPLARSLRMRDCSAVQDIVDAEYRAVATMASERAGDEGHVHQRVVGRPREE